MRLYFHQLINLFHSTILNFLLKVFPNLIIFYKVQVINFIDYVTLFFDYKLLLTKIVNKPIQLRAF